MQKTKSGEVNSTVETKGRVWEGTAAKGEPIGAWCQQVSAATKAEWRCAPPLMLSVLRHEDGVVAPRDAKR